MIGGDICLSDEGKSDVSDGRVTAVGIMDRQKGDQATVGKDKSCILSQHSDAQIYFLF